MPLLEHNISANARFYSASHTRPQALVLDWNDERLPAEVATVNAGFDLIVWVFITNVVTCTNIVVNSVCSSMADVAYNTASFVSLIRTMDQILSLGDTSGRSESPLVLLGYKERDAAERSLWDMTRSIGLRLEKVGEKPGAGGCPVEIWAGRRRSAFSSADISG